jgi:hypothetical protein
VTADIQQMFHCFYVRPDHRNFLRFFWHRDNDFKKELVEYRMKVHVFGNRPSPAVAIYGLHRTTLVAAETFGSDIKKFVFTSLGLSRLTERTAPNYLGERRHFFIVYI